MASFDSISPCLLGKIMTFALEESLNLTSSAYKKSHHKTEQVHFVPRTSIYLERILEESSSLTLESLRLSKWLKTT